MFSTGSVPTEETAGGFDLVLGNPPWIKVEWKERDILGEFNPEFEIRKHSASDLTKRVQDEFVTRPGLRTAWLTELEGTAATQTFLNAKPNYPLLAGQQANLYKCFLPQGWIIGSARGRGRLPAPRQCVRRPLRWQPARRVVSQIAGALSIRKRKAFVFRYPSPHHSSASTYMLLVSPTWYSRTYRTCIRPPPSKLV